MKTFKIVSFLSVFTLILSCSPSKQALQKTLEENPEIIFSAIEKDPVKFMETVSRAAQKAKELSQQQEMDRYFTDPLKPTVSNDRAVWGPKTAAVTIIEYSDFECPYCQRGYQSVKAVKEKYGDQVRVVYKHLPLSFHPLAMPAAQRFEAIALQDHDKAYQFHDEIFQNQDKFKQGKEKWMDSVAAKLKVNVAKMKTDMNSKTVKDRIAADMAEAQKFNITGTPGFVVGGVPLSGAQPPESFAQIIDRHLGGSKPASTN